MTEKRLNFVATMDTVPLAEGAEKAKGIIHKLAHNVKNANVFLPLAAAGVFTVVAAKAHEFSKEFEMAMTEVKTISSDVQKDFEGISKKVIDMGAAGADSALELTKALYQIVSAGQQGAIAYETLEASSRLAVAGLTSVFTTADALTSIMNAYGEKAGTANEISDKLFTTVKNGKTRMEELAGSIGTVTGLAAQAGLEFDDLMAAYSTGTKTLKTDIFTTGMRGLLTAVIEGGTDEAKEMIERLGIEFDVTALKSKGLVKFLQDIIVATNGNIESLSLLMPNIRGLTGFLSLATNGGEEFAIQLDNIKNSTGSMESAYQKMMNTETNQWRMVHNKWEREIKNLGDAMVEAGAGTARFFNAMLTGMEDMSTKAPLIMGFFDRITALKQLGASGIGAYLGGLVLPNAVIQPRVDEIYTNANAGLTEQKQKIEHAKKITNAKEAIEELHKIEKELHDEQMKLGLEPVDFENKTDQSKREATEMLRSRRLAELKSEVEQATIAIKKQAEADIGYQRNRLEEVNKQIEAEEKLLQTTSAANDQDPEIKKITGRLASLQLERAEIKNILGEMPKLSQATVAAANLRIEKLQEELEQSTTIEQAVSIAFQIQNEQQFVQQYKDKISKALADADADWRLELDEYYARKTTFDGKNEKIPTSLTKKLVTDKLEPMNAKKLTAEQQKQLDIAKQITEQEFKQIDAEEARVKKLNEISGIMGDSSEILGAIGYAFRGINTEMSDAFDNMSRIAGQASDLMVNIAEGNWVGVAANAIGMIGDFISMTKGESEESVIDKINDSLEKQNQILGRMQTADWLKTVGMVTGNLNAQLDTTLAKLSEISVSTFVGWSGETRTVNRDGIEFTDPVPIFEKVDTTGWDIDKWIEFYNTYMLAMNDNDHPSGFTEEEIKNLKLYGDQLIDLNEQLDALEAERRFKIVGVDVSEVTNSIIDGMESGFKLGQEKMTVVGKSTFTDAFGKEITINTYGLRNELGDFAESFGKLMEQSLRKHLENVLNEKILVKFMEQFEKAMNDGNLTEQEKKELQDNYAKAVKEAQEMWKTISPVLPTTEETAPTGALRIASEETVSLMVGQFYAMRDNLNGIDTTLAAQLELVEQSLEYQRETAVNTRQLARLENIEKYTLDSQRILNDRL